ncbi:hypothetical protein [Natronomonas amylolytica]|uniref:hypothetical protein n=1 Tax=Natronomonas amylolytica TaxID=3108498 RepID=UPI00300843DE
MAEVVDRLERNLMSLGVYVEDHAVEEPEDGEGDRVVHVEYETTAGGLTQGDIGNVCTELVDAHETGWEPQTVHCWVFNTDGGFHGEWEARAGWFRALERGDISQTDFSTLVLSTRQPADEPPAEVPAFGPDTA